MRAQPNGTTECAELNLLGNRAIPDGCKEVPLTNSDLKSGQKGSRFSRVCTVTLGAWVIPGCLEAWFLPEPKPPDVGIVGGLRLVDATLGKTDPPSLPGNAMVCWF